MSKSIGKAYEIKDAQIQFVSLVDKAANQRQFLLKKAEGGQASFTSYGRILKTDAVNHYVTGIVYEPMTEDSQGDFMTEEEITKAAYWFAKNGDKVDLQHSFEPLPGAAVVENWVAKADFEVAGQPVKKGSWLMTVEVTDNDVWAAIEKNKYTGFSMGGLANYSEENVNLQKQGLLQQLTAALTGVLNLGGKSSEPEPAVVEKEGKALNKQKMEEIVAAAVEKALQEQAVAAAVEKALREQAVPAVIEQPAQPTPAEATQPVTAEQVQEIVEAAIAKALTPVLQSKGVPSNLNDSVQKTADEVHYLRGIL